MKLKLYLRDRSSYVADTLWRVCLQTRPLFAFLIITETIASKFLALLFTCTRYKVDITPVINMKIKEKFISYKLLLPFIFASFKQRQCVIYVSLYYVQLTI